MWLRKLKTMCLTRRILQLNSVKKQVITRLSGYVPKSSFIYQFRVRGDDGPDRCR